MILPLEGFDKIWVYAYRALIIRVTLHTTALPGSTTTLPRSTTLHHNTSPKHSTTTYTPNHAHTCSIHHCASLQKGINKHTLSSPPLTLLRFLHPVTPIRLSSPSAFSLIALSLHSPSLFLPVIVLCCFSITLLLYFLVLVFLCTLFIHWLLVVCPWCWYLTY